MSVGEIKQAAVSRIRDLVLVGELGLADGRADGIHWKCRNPQRSDRTAGSFVVDIGGSKPGRFMEFAAGADARSGEGGDVIDLVSYCLSGPAAFKSKEARGNAIAWLSRWTGVGASGPVRRVSPEEKRARDEKYAAAEAERVKVEAGERREKAERAKSWWLGSGQSIKDTPIELYLENVRGVPLSEVKLTGAIRALPPSGRGPHWTMFSAMVRTNPDGKGEICAVHMTYLTPDGRKADVEPGKKMWGDTRGAAIRIAKGDVGVSPEQAVAVGKTGPLAICEGIEDAITLALLWPGFQIWSAGSVGNLRAIAEVGGWPGCADQVVLVADNDQAGSAAAQAFNKAVTAWMTVSDGRDVSVLRSHNHKDVNDAWRAQGAG